jgi:hypothetical protein
MADQEFVTFTWTKTTVVEYKEIKIDVNALRAIITEHAPHLDAWSTVQERLDAASGTKYSDLIQAAVAERVNAEGDLQSEDIDDVEHDAEDLAENFCEECEERHEDCTCCVECGEAECTCEDEDGEDEDGEDEDED